MSAPTPSIEARASDLVRRYRRPFLAVAPIVSVFAIPLGLLALMRTVTWAAGVTPGEEARGLMAVLACFVGAFLCVPVFIFSWEALKEAK